MPCWIINFLVTYWVLLLSIIDWHFRWKISTICGGILHTWLERSHNQLQECWFTTTRCAKVLSWIMHCCVYKLAILKWCIAEELISQQTNCMLLLNWLVQWIIFNNYYRQLLHTSQWSLTQITWPQQDQLTLKFITNFHGFEAMSLSHLQVRNEIYKKREILKYEVDHC